MLRKATARRKAKAAMPPILYWTTSTNPESGAPCLDVVDGRLCLVGRQMPHGIRPVPGDIALGRADDGSRLGVKVRYRIVEVEFPLTAALPDHWKATVKVMDD